MLTCEIKQAYNLRVKTKTAIDEFGGVAELAEALDISPAAIYQWGERVPLLRQYQIRDIKDRKPAPRRRVVGAGA